MEGLPMRLTKSGQEVLRTAALQNMALAAQAQLELLDWSPRDGMANR